MSKALIPGPCVFCYELTFLRSIPGGQHGDGVCEGCDEIMFKMYFPMKQWVSWERQNEERARQAARTASSRARVASRPSGVPVVQATAGSRAHSRLRVAS